VAVVSPPLRATVTRVRVRPGDAVDAGTPLLDVLMPDVLEAAGRLEGARARLTAWTERHQQLEGLKREGLARTLDVSEAAARVAEAKAELQAARATLLAAGLREADAAPVLAGAGTVPLRAPITGVVAEVTATLGEAHEPTSGPLLRLLGAGAVRVEARLPRPPEGTGWRFLSAAGTTPLRLVSAASIADARDGTFLAWFEPTEDVGLTPGTQGRVTRDSERAPRALVPAIAVRRRDGAAFVVTRRGEVPIDVARCDAESCTVAGALQPGDEVRAEPLR
jgi:biotin carboxyl carrier protein